MNKHFAATLYTSRQLSVRTRWRPFYICSRCLSTASNPALFRQLEDGTGLSTFRIQGYLQTKVQVLMNGTEQPITEDDLFRYQRHRWLYVLPQVSYCLDSG
jgi:hypothetical protein